MAVDVADVAAPDVFLFQLYSRRAVAIAEAVGVAADSVAVEVAVALEASEAVEVSAAAEVARVGEFRFPIPDSRCR